MRTSIIVCTRNRSASVKETLDSLFQLDACDYEVLVVDNSTGTERELTEKYSSAAGVRYLHEPRRGLNVARNTGIAHAGGDILAFTDDDCLPEKNWLQATLRNFSEASVWACTSRIVQHSREGAADLFEAVAGQDLGEHKRTFTRDDIHFGPGFLLANLRKVFAKHMKSSAPVPFGIGHGSGMVFRKAVFKDGGCGLFDERFGSGAKLGGCDDIEMLYRVLKSGHSVVYEPAAVVRHKHRFALEDVFKTRYDYSRSGAIFLRQYRRDALMFTMFYGRLTQLAIKTAQYKLTGNKDLARSFGSDLQGFLEGWKLHRNFEKENRSAAQPVVKAP
jgi:glycosyltransferase involved in cell wall biosynthesis